MQQIRFMLAGLRRDAGGRARSQRRDHLL